MNDSIFKAIPPNVDFRLFFELEEQALLGWLMTISNGDSKTACYSILQLVLTLNKKKVAPKKRIILLTILGEHLKEYINQLDHSCWDANFPFSSEEKEYAEIITWNYLALAEGFFIAADSFILKASMPFPLAMALESLRRAQLHIAVTYSVPNVGFWELTYKIFALAERKNLLEFEIKELRNVTINKLFLHILIFQVSDTKQYPPRDMQTIFTFLDKICEDLFVCRDVDHDSGLFIFDLDSDDAPINIKALQKLVADSVRYLSPVLAAKNIEKLLKHGDTWAGSSKSINEILFHRLAKTLSLEQKRLHARKLENHIQLGVIGFHNILGFLYKATKNIDINPIPAWTKSSQEPLEENSKLDIFEDELVIQARKLTSKKSKEAIKNKIWDQQQQIFKPASVKVSLTKINIFDSSSTGYLVFWENDDASKVKVGDIFALLSEDKKRLEIALIRRITMIEDKKFRYGVEIIGFNCEIVYIDHLDSKDGLGMWAILIPSTTPNQHDTLIYKANNFETGERVYLLRNQRETTLATLKKEIYSTTNIVHTELVLFSVQKN